METIGYVYILTNQSNTVLYTGVTSDLVLRIQKHKDHVFEGFTRKYNVTKLVYFEPLNSIKAAIEKEKHIKSESRKKKINLINTLNPEWKDLYYEISGFNKEGY